VKYGVFPEGETQTVGKLVKDAEKGFAAGLADDLNISVAMTAVFDLVKKANTLIDRGRIKTKDAEKLTAFIGAIDKVLAVVTPKKKHYGLRDYVLHAEPGHIKVNGQAAELTSKPEPATAGAEVPAGVTDKLAARQAARAAKDYALADRIRQEIESLGFLIEDTKQGPRVVPRKPPA
jgi:cysteinyl-tRNA synthetase